jgi:hypothetical protein
MLSRMQDIRFTFDACNHCFDTPRSLLAASRRGWVGFDRTCDRQVVCVSILWGVYVTGECKGRAQQSQTLALVHHCPITSRRARNGRETHAMSTAATMKGQVGVCNNSVIPQAVVSND